MRFDRIDLTRYGKFTDHSLDLGLAEEGRPDLHVVYGPNEAGKSTLLSGLLDLMFGIEQKSRYGFLHSYPAMRIGARVTIGGLRQDVSRLKRRLNSLVDAEDRPLPDAFFSAALGGIDRATYQAMFSLDDESIERGGEAILRSEGELGSLLFSASSGLPETSSILSARKAAADAFFKPQGRKHRLAELRAELDALKSEKAAVDLHARDYAALRKACDAAAVRHEAVLGDLADLRLSRDRTEALRAGLPLMERLRDLRARLAEEPPAPEIGDDWHRRLPEIARRDTELATRANRLDEEIAAFEAERASVSIDKEVLAVADRVARLGETSLESRYRTATLDLPVRVDERQRLFAEAERLAAAIDAPGDADPLSLLLPPAAVARLEALARQVGGLTERLQSAIAEAEKATDGLRLAEAARARIAVPEAGEADLARLLVRIQILRQDDSLMRARGAERQVMTLESRLADQIAGLFPFEGSAEALGRRAAPAADEIAAWKRDRERLQQERQALDVRLHEEEARIAALKARAGVLAAEPGLVDDTSAATLRRAREEAWQAHRETLDTGTAARFERALRDDDAAVAARLGSAARLAELRELAASSAEAEARHGRLRERHAACDAALLAIEETVAAAAQRCGLPADTGLTRLEDWLARRARALEAQATLAEARGALALARTDEARALGTLVDDLLAVDPACQCPPRLDAALSLAEEMAGRLRAERTAVEAADDAVRKAGDEEALRRAAVERARAGLDDWKQSWSACLADTWLGAQDTLPEPEAIGAIFSVLRNIERIGQALSDRDHRIASMRSDIRQFDAEMQHLEGLAGSAASGGNVEDRLAAVRERLRQAEDRDALHRRLTRELDARMAERRGLAAEQADHARVKAELFGLLGCTTIGEAEILLDRARRQQALRIRIADTESDLCRMLDVATADMAEARLAAVDAGSLAGELSLLMARLGEAEHEAAELAADHRGKERALREAGGDDRAAHIEERRRTLVEDIADQAQRYLAERAGILALERGLQLYRERHRSAMMRKASEAFSLISGGEYAGLSVLPEGDRDILVAMPALGGSRLITELSKGTRFQLYLALRVAGYHEIAASREAVPFIADDIMETFDDGRAFHAFRLMAAMAGRGQVVYLTHHAHLCDIATSACPDVQIHRL
ncbi:AAA family ATPase [Ensifer soli]|uniref:AAA family ATPase n=1 Tax=Ciceribacter sp. sgz301302 TaxID=3342379 RepID=UPI0035B9EA7F